MAHVKKSEEVGDLFVSKTLVAVKLLPSRKSGSRPIRWFSSGQVANVKNAARDIKTLVGKLRGKSRVVRSLTVMTDRGMTHDIIKSRLAEAVEQAGFSVLR